MKIIVVGGGAAGFFSALAAKKSQKDTEVIILEGSSKLLSKVRISGGGRCNVTHACFDPKLLVQNYPRGQKELLGPFHRFGPRDTIEWFKDRGVVLKTEPDGRMFPVTNSSETIIDCFLKEAKKLGVIIYTQTKLKSLRKVDTGFELETNTDLTFTADKVILATGSARAGWNFAESLGHTIQTPVPSLFSFNIPSFPLVDLSGVSINQAGVKLEGTKFKQEGPLLITHRGFSGPCLLKLSAFAARFLAEKEYKVPLIVDWLPQVSEEELQELVEKERYSHPKKQVFKLRIFPLPKSLWIALCKRAGIAEDLTWNSFSKALFSTLCKTLKNDLYQVSGKTANKEEFVTCGGITLTEIEFKNMESRCCSNLYFCGEILDIDGVTGGFNFQNAWTTGQIAGTAAATEGSFNIRK